MRHSSSNTNYNPTVEPTEKYANNYKRRYPARIANHALNTRTFNSIPSTTPSNMFVTQNGPGQNQYHPKSPQNIGTAGKGNYKTNLYQNQQQQNELLAGNANTYGNPQLSANSYGTYSVYPPS